LRRSGDLIRAKLKREKSLKLTVPPSPGKAYTRRESPDVGRSAEAAQQEHLPGTRTRSELRPRDNELRELRWRQIDLVHKKQLTVGKSKTEAELDA